MALCTENGERKRMTFQVADITKILVSAGKIVSKGHKIVLDGGGEGSYILHKATGSRTPLYRKGNVFVMRAWVEPPTAKGKKDTDKMDIGQVDCQGFSRRGN